MREIAVVEGLTERFVAQQMQLALLSPDFVERLLAGRVRPIANARSLILRSEMPSPWAEQEQFIGGVGRSGPPDSKPKVGSFEFPGDRQ